MTMKPENELNDAAILDQMREHWQKIAMLVLWKFRHRLPVKITSKDIEECQSYYAPHGPIVLTHGMSDAVELSLVTKERADSLAEYDKQRKGNT